MGRRGRDAAERIIRIAEVPPKGVKDLSPHIGLPSPRSCTEKAIPRTSCFKEKKKAEFTSVEPEGCGKQRFYSSIKGTDKISSDLGPRAEVI